MRGDFTRHTFRPENHYSGVRMQQGRVQLDADWNEQVDISAHLRRQALRDLTGPAGGPAGRAGFQIVSRAEGQPLAITRGRYYVDGLQVDNEVGGQDPVGFDAQPYLPGINPTLGLSAGSYLFYLDVWERQVTALEEQALREVALGGPDTTTRSQVVWQVKPLRIGDTAAKLDCAAYGADWHPPQSGTTGKMKARVQPAATATEADCLLPPQGGYRGLENHLYRVEVHEGGDETQATFKWSRENGSVVTIWNELNGHQVTVGNVGKDDHLRFTPGSWVELSSDEHELIAAAGTLARVQVVTEDRLTIDLGSATGSLEPNDFPGTRTARRWEGVGKVADFLAAKEVENGLEIQFTSGYYRSGDYWLIPARAQLHDGGGTIEWPEDQNGSLAQPPIGILHAYCVLALGRFDGQVWIDLTDCRRLFPPLTQVVGGTKPGAGSSCSPCTVMVGDGSLSHGDFNDLQAAVDYARFLQRPVSVCVLPGLHLLRKPVAVIGAPDAPITLQGYGAGAQLRFLERDRETSATVTRVYPGESIAVAISNAMEGRHYEILVSEEVASDEHWLRAGRVAAGDGGTLPVSVTLPTAVARADWLRLRVRDSERPGVFWDTVVDNSKPQGQPRWWEMPQPTEDLPSLLIAGPFVRLVNLDIDGHVPQMPVVMVLGESISVEECRLTSAFPLTLALLQGRDVHMTGNRIRGQSPTVTLQGRDVHMTENRIRGQLPTVTLQGHTVQFRGNQVQGGVHIASGSAVVDLHDNRIMIAGEESTDAAGVLLGNSVVSLMGGELTALLRWFESGKTAQIGAEEVTSDEFVLDRGVRRLTSTTAPSESIYLPSVGYGEISLSEVTVRENRIQGGSMGVVVPQDRMAQLVAHDLRVLGNDIQTHGRRATRRNSRPGVGVLIQASSGVRVEDNMIGSSGSPANGVGIGVFHCSGVEISRNRVLYHDGSQSENRAASFLAGILAVDIRELPGTPAAIVRENLVVTPAGPALVLVGLGDMTITDNHLTSLDVAQQPFPEIISDEVMKVLVSRKLTLGLCVTIFQLGTGEEDERRLHSSVRFAANRVEHSRATAAVDPEPAVNVLFSLGELFVAHNQFVAQGEVQSSEHHAQQWTHVRVEGVLTRVLGNSFLEPPSSVTFSCISAGTANITADNQAVHCIDVQPAHSQLTVDRNNQSVFACKAVATGIAGGLRAMAEATSPAFGTLLRGESANVRPLGTRSSVDRDDGTRAEEEAEDGRSERDTREARARDEVETGVGVDDTQDVLAREEVEAAEGSMLPTVELPSLWSLYRPLLHALATYEAKKAGMLEEAVTALAGEDTWVGGGVARRRRTAEQHSLDIKNLDRRAKVATRLAEELRRRAEPRTTEANSDAADD